MVGVKILLTVSCVLTMIYFVLDKNSPIESLNFNTSSTLVSNKTVYTIPVVWHVFTPLANPTSYPEDLIHDALAKLNADFNNKNVTSVTFNFVLAKIDLEGRCTNFEKLESIVLNTESNISKYVWLLKEYVDRQNWSQADNIYNILQSNYSDVLAQEASTIGVYIIQFNDGKSRIQKKLIKVD